MHDIPSHPTCSVCLTLSCCRDPPAAGGSSGILKAPLSQTPGVSYQMPLCPAAQQLPPTAASFPSLSYPVLLFLPEVRTSVGARPQGHRGQTDGFWRSAPHLAGLRLEWLSVTATREACARAPVCRLQKRGENSQN